MVSNTPDTKNVEKAAESVPEREIDETALIEANKRVLSEDTLRNIHSLNDAFRALEIEGISAEDYADYGTGFDVLDSDNKSRLLKVPFAILEWTFTKGNFGEYVACVVVTEDGGKYILLDGSTGIREQLRSVTRQRIAKGLGCPQQGLIVRKGLRVSEYDYVDPKTHETSKAKTYYLAN